MKAPCFHGFFRMKTVRFQRIGFFLLLSFLFHTTLLFALSSLVQLSKRTDNIEVYIVSKLDTDIRQSPMDRVKSLENKYNKIKVLPELKTERSTYSPEETETLRSPDTDRETTTDWGDKKSNPQDTPSVKMNQSNVAASDGAIIDAEFGSSSGPKLVYYEKPTYPPMARRLGKEGRVLLRLTIDEKGELINVEVLESAPYGFTEAALEAVKRSKFAPAKRDGKPITSRALLPIRFVLTN